MEVVTSPRLTRSDLEVISRLDRELEDGLASILIRDLDPERLADEFIRDHVGALAWMLKHRVLEIRLAIPVDDAGNPLTHDVLAQQGLFHLKVGLLEDYDGNQVSFSGSLNESAAGWTMNVEEFKVFRSWEASEVDYVRADLAKFQRFWEQRSARVRVLDIPQALREKFIDLAPADPVDSLERRYSTRKQRRKKLFHHQREAVRSWLNRGRKGIFAMATGTGKTVTALGCLEATAKEFRSLTTVISCPYSHLLSQWKKELAEYGITYEKLVTADATNPRWKDELANALADMNMGYCTRLIVLTTHKTASSSVFIETITSHTSSSIELMLVADEVHALGAQKLRRALLPEYRSRLGLSATPDRWFDPSGTQALMDYFGGVAFEFGLDQAIGTVNPATGLTYLVPFSYAPHFLPLTEDELIRYMEISRKLVSFLSAGDPSEWPEAAQLLLFKRANIIKDAEAKYSALSDLIEELGPDDMSHTVIYCSPHQLRKVLQILNRFRIPCHRFTMNEGTSPRAELGHLSERDYILQKFAEGRFRVLAAMKCLDEGVDVPPARRAILMASSGNPREYVQRIGRVIRQYPGKQTAEIHDFVVAPLLNDYLGPELREVERRVFAKELVRCEDIAGMAQNTAEAIIHLSRLRQAIL